ncbi:14939_t:CDS:10 [Entrophospora sp. SA101]|nr:14939_t:CDS:10 [Entrophospora sp. SA101]
MERFPKGSDHLSLLLPSKKASSSNRTPSLISISPANFTLKQSPHCRALCQPTWREKLAVELDSSAIGSIWKLVDALLNILLCIIYIANTAHMNKVLPLLNVWLEALVSALLIMEYIPKFYIFEFWSWKSFFMPFLTFLTIFPVGATTLDHHIFQEARYIVLFYPFRFIRCYLSIYACLIRSEKSVIKFGQVTSRILIFLNSILFIVLTGSALLHSVEYAYMDADITFLDAVFFTTIMLGTVGYLGHIIPDNASARIFLLVIFTTGLIFIPYSISELIALIRSKSIYDRPFRKISKQPHVIIIAPTIELPSLRHFLKEFYSLAHGLATINTKVVILNPAEPNARVKTFLSDPLYAHRIQFIRGSSLESRSLKKANAKNASAYFILAKKYTQQSETIDAENVLRAMALSKHDVGPKLYIQCILPENKAHFENLNPEIIICIDELKLAILAHSCLTPGFSTLLYGLTTSFTYESTYELRNTEERYNSSIGMGNDIIEDYIDGISRSIYATNLSDYFIGYNFLSAVGCLYESLGVVLFAIAIPKQHSTTGQSTSLSYNQSNCEGENAKNYMVLINPGDYILRGDEIGYIIASDSELADGVSNYKWHSLQIRNNGNLSSEPQQTSSERQPLLSSNVSKNNVSVGHSDTKKRSNLSKKPDQQYHEYPHKSDSSTLRHHRSLSTPLASAADHDHDRQQQHHHDRRIHSIDPSSSSLNAFLDNDQINSMLDTVSGHILLCDYSTATFPRNLDCFVGPLRKAHLEKFTPIVILSPVRPTQSQWKILSQFDQVYIVQGNPMTREALDIGKIKFAKQATEDAPAMLVYLNIKAMCNDKDVDIFVEFVHMDNMKFISEDTSVINKNMQAHNSPAFMAGICFSLSMLDSIICQSFYQPHIVAIIHQLLFGTNLHSDATYSAPAHSHIFQIPVPVRFIGSQYGLLFQFLLDDKKSIPLGLYRSNKAKTPNGMVKCFKYVYTCPKYNVILKEDDKAFVLSKRIPSGL